MRADDLEQTLAHHLLKNRAGWARHDQRPGCFEHAATGLLVTCYQQALTVTLSPGGDEGHGMSVKTGFYPSAALTTLLEVVDALVLKRVVGARNWQPRKGAASMPAGDLVLVLCAQLGGLTPTEAARDPQWTIVAGWSKPPNISTMSRALAELRNAGLVSDAYDDRRNRLTPAGWLEATQIIDRLGLVLPEPVRN